MTGPRVVERVTRRAALGLRFWDAAGATAAVDGLRVEVYPRANPRARAVALPTRGGVYAAHAVPGLREFERADDGADDLWAAVRPYRVEVSDAFGRFLPIAFDAELPARGVYAWRAPGPSPQPPAPPGAPAAGLPPQLPPGHVPLYSAPTRPVPDPLAVVRAHLRVLGTEREAAWGLLAVSVDGRTCGVGLADARGHVAVLFPYPEPPRPSLASRPEARSDFTWSVTLTGYVPPDASPPRAVPAFADLADVVAALASPREVVASAGAPAPPAAPWRLAYRQALTVRTAGGADAGAAYLSAPA